jgi:hypothetical protein
MPIYYIFKGIFLDMVFDGRIQHLHLLMAILWIFFFWGDFWWWPTLWFWFRVWSTIGRKSKVMPISNKSILVIIIFCLISLTMSFVWCPPHYLLFDIFPSIIKDAFAILVASGHHLLNCSRRWQFKIKSLHLILKSTRDMQDDQL